MNYASAVIQHLQAPDYAPVTADELAGDLGVKKTDSNKFQKELKDLIKSGTVVRVKGDRLCLPRDADLVTGRIRFRARGSAMVFPDDTPGQTERDPLLIHAENTGVAFNGDHVLVRLMRSSRKPRIRKLSSGKVEVVKQEETGRVIRILERKRTTVTGTLHKSRFAFYVIVDDPRFIHDIIVPDPAQTGVEPLPKVGDKVVVELDAWEQPHLNPEGEIVEVLGKSHTPGAEYQALLRQYDLDPEFPDEVMREVSELPQKVKKSQLKDRLDLRDTFTLTIDPDDAKDFDDAISLETLPDGNRRLGVHIADVTAYVAPDTALDKEARRRGNSTYLVGAVIPMLPHDLSNGICSLVEDEDRLTKSVFFVVGKNGSLGKPEFANTVIRSNKRLSYRQAYAFLQEDDLQVIRELPSPPKHQTGASGRELDELDDATLQQLQDTIREAWQIAGKLRDRRMASGSLDLDMPEVKIFVDEDGSADRIERIANDESHQLIEEFMLAANEAVARTMHTENIPAIHRVHEQPNAERLEELRETLDGFGLKTGDLTKRNEVTKLLAAIKEHPQAQLLRIEFLRSLQQARYAAEPLGHYGLHKQFYLHFTSPIRRYADLAVHRIFNHHLAKLGQRGNRKRLRGLGPDNLKRLAEHLSITEQNSTEAERESVKIKLLEFFERELQKEPKNKFWGLITDVRNHGFFLELEESLAYGMVHVSTLRDDLYQLNDDGTKLVGRRQKRHFGIGDRIEVVIHKVDRYKRQMDFAVPDDGASTPGRGGGKPKGKGKGKSRSRRDDGGKGQRHRKRDDQSRSKDKKGARRRKKR